MDEYQSAATALQEQLEAFKTTVDNVLALIEQKRQAVVAEVKDKVTLDTREKELLEREVVVSQKEKDHEQLVKDDTERKHLLDIKERQLNAEKQRFQTLIDSL